MTESQTHTFGKVSYNRTQEKQSIRPPSRRERLLHLTDIHQSAVIKDWHATLVRDVYLDY